MGRPYARGVALLLAAVLTSCGSDDPADKPSTAFCADLKSGLTVFQIYQGVKTKYPDPAEYADLAYGFAAISCPEQLTTNEDLRNYLDGWGINPDA